MDTKKDPFQNLQERMRNALADHSIRAFQELSSSTRDLMSCYRCAIMEIETKFRVLNERFSLQHDRNPIDSIQSRLKSPDSILDKMLRKKLPFTLEAIENNIFDIAGIRVVCSFVDDIYMLADCLLQQDDITLIERKDYIKNPKKNGYRSLHYERCFRENGVLYHHILDPHTGYPADTGLSSVTILSDSSTDGDALSTSCFLLGYEKGRELIDSLPDIEALFVLSDGTIYRTEGFPQS